jgi:aarF domain-containing kinase
MAFHKASNQKVAVKIIHPHIKEQIESDLDIMRMFAWFVELFPGMHNFSLSENVEEFAALMLSQLDLKLEASSLDKFRHNFKCNEKDRNSIDIKSTKELTFPRPIYPFVSTNILMEEYIEGFPISDMFNADSVTRKKLAALGLQAILKMVFEDNYIHAGKYIRFKYLYQ